MELPAPFRNVISYPADYGFTKSKQNKKELAALKRLVRHSKTIGLTYVRDEPVFIALVDNLRRRAKLAGMAYSPSTPYAVPHWIGLDADLLKDGLQWRVTVQHELAHVLAATFGKKVAWKMQDPVTLARDGCAPDLDRWTWHMQRALDQLSWYDGTFGLDLKPR